MQRFNCELTVIENETQLTHIIPNELVLLDFSLFIIYIYQSGVIIPNKYSNQENHKREFQKHFTEILPT